MNSNTDILKSLLPNIIDKKQQQSLLNAISIGIPSMKNEEWKYTYYNKIIDNNFSNITSKADDAYKLSDGTIDEIKNHIETQFNATYKIVFVDGVFIAELSYIPNTPKFTFWNSNNIEEQATKDFLLELNNALSSDGININIDKSFEEEKAIAILYIATKSDQIINLKHKINIAKKTQVHFTEYYINPNHLKTYYNIVNNISIHENSIVKWDKIQNGKQQFYITDNTFVQQEKSSIFTVNTITVSGAITRNNLVVDINGEHAECNMNGLYLLNGHEHCDNRTKVNHNQPNTNSNELYKGIVDGEATGVFNGKILVDQIAQKTNAFQSNKNIIINDKANIYTKPQLEIFADDVKCSHGATIAQIEDTELFYLQARGIGKEKARALLTIAFAEEVIEKVDSKDSCNYLIEAVEAKLNI
ncbi:MAG: Fe-S cluster assembly protein SufD [Sphingobacteriales bacterium]|nr:MAG: Fe-S cluster assembly protein SufD [Sphingobacteriales bacterium]